MEAAQTQPPDQTTDVTTPQELRDWIISMDYPPPLPGGPWTELNPQDNICPANWRFVCSDLGIKKPYLYALLKGQSPILPHIRQKMDDLSMLRRVHDAESLSETDLAYIDSRIANLPAELALIAKLYRARKVTSHDLDYLDILFSKPSKAA